MVRLKKGENIKFFMTINNKQFKFCLAEKNDKLDMTNFYKK